MISFSKIKSYFFLIFLMLQANITLGQENDFIYGTLINADDQTPIPFVHITIKNKAKGTISNMDGGFRIPEKYYKSRDTLVISSIGYSSKIIPLLSLNRNLRNEIILVRKEEVLDEVVLGASEKKKRRRAQEIDYSSSKKKKRRSAREIVELAINKIPENYPFIPFSYIGYYRDYQLKEGDYVNLNEAILQVFDPGFGVADSAGTQTRIYRFDRNHTFPRDTIAAEPYEYVKGKKIIDNVSFGSPNVIKNEFTLLRTHDAIRSYNINSFDFVDQMDVDFVRNHQFKRLPVTSIDSIALYAIGIKKLIQNISVIGKIFISMGDFKIYKMQYAVYKKDAQFASQKKSETNDKSSAKKGNKLGKLLYESIVEYRSQNAIMYPNYISFNNSFENWQPAGFFPIDEEFVNAKLIKITFNKEPLEEYAMKKKNYRLLNELKEFQIDRVQLDKNVVLLHLDKEVDFDSDQNKLSNSNVKQKPRIKYKNIRDISGHLLNAYEYVSYNQFREFFVQELQIDSQRPIDSLFMDNNRPIYKNQPIAPYTNLQDYWMNTPLKN